MRFASPERLKLIQPLLKAGLPRPNMFLDIYKNRRSQYKRVKLWMHVDLGTCRFTDLFLTNEYGEEIPLELLRAAYAENVPTIEEIKVQNANKTPKQAAPSLQSLIGKQTTTQGENGVNITV